MIYPINEIFLSVQGEATWTGTPCVFVRFQGCSVGCAFCDTKHTWSIDRGKLVSGAEVMEKQADAATWAEMTEDEIVFRVKGLCGDSKVRHVVLTGGEPADQRLGPLAAALLAAGYGRVQLETSGTSEVDDCGLCWVTLSPKINQLGGKHVLPAVVARADEIKHPVATQKHLDELLCLLASGDHKPGVSVWLQPLSLNAKATSNAVEWATRYGWRISIQTHRYLSLR